MKKRMLVAVVLVASLYIGGVIGYNLKKPVQATPTAQTQTKPPTIAELLKLVNAERAKHGVAPLKEDARLDASAQMKANDEVAYGYFGHISPNGSPYVGKHGYELINLTGISCKTDSENLHQSGTLGESAEDVIASLDSSPAHHAAMIDAKYSLTGFGINGTQVVEHFCQQ